MVNLGKQRVPVRHPQELLSKDQEFLAKRTLHQDEDVQTDEEILKQNKKVCLKDLNKGVNDFLEAKKSGGYKNMSTNQLVRNLRKEVIMSG